MSTTIVTPEVQRPQHFVSCDEQAIGRRVLRFARHDNLARDALRQAVAR